MLVSRLLVASVLLPVGVVLIIYGGIPFTILVAAFMGLAAWEYVKLLRAGGLEPAGIFVPVGAVLFVLGRSYNAFESADWIICTLVLFSMAYHMLQYERGRDRAATDFAVSLGGMLYIGWLGAYLISLRNLPEGKWWVLTVLPAVWLADTGAYFIGGKFGRHKLAARLSPKKTWEGYLAGIVIGCIGTGLLVLLWNLGTAPLSNITPWRGVLIGAVLSVLAPLGDLGESMIKRQVGIKDSGNILKGHGGALDRIDSWLWAGAIGYYIIQWFFI